MSLHQGRVELYLPTRDEKTRGATAVFNLERCRSCLAEVIMVPHERTARMAPMNLAHVEGVAENIALQVEDDGHVTYAIVPAGQGKFSPHFATCPEAQRWRRRDAS